MHLLIAQFCISQSKIFAQKLVESVGTHYRVQMPTDAYKCLQIAMQLRITTVVVKPSDRCLQRSMKSNLVCARNSNQIGV